MKVVVIGPKDELAQWPKVRALIEVLGPQDEIVHTGMGQVGNKIDYVAKSAKGMARKRLPRIEVQIPEIGRYERAEAFVRNAAQLLQHQAPHVVVWFGEGDDEEVKPVLELAERAFPRVTVMDVDEFLRSRQ